MLFSRWYSRQQKRMERMVELAWLKKIRKNFTYRQTQLRSLKTRKVYENYDPDKSWAYKRMRTNLFSNVAHKIRPGCSQNGQSKQTPLQQRLFFFVAYQGSLYNELKPLPKSNVHKEQLFNLYLRLSFNDNFKTDERNGQLLSTNISIFFKFSKVWSLNEWRVCF